MKKLAVIFIAFITFSGCAKKAAQAPLAITQSGGATVTDPPVKVDSISYLALGDSYTSGEAEPQAQSFPYQLIASLRSDNYTVSKPTVIAVTGWTTDDLINAIAGSGITDKKYDFVTLLIGVNDQYQYLSKDNYKIKFAQVLNTAINFAQGDTSLVFVLSIPDWGVTPYGSGQDALIGPDIDQFNAINKAISIRAGVHYLDITGISREAATDLSLVAPDALHPSGKMYALWVAQLEPMVAQRLNKKN